MLLLFKSVKIYNNHNKRVAREMITNLPSPLHTFWIASMLALVLSFGTTYAIAQSDFDDDDDDVTAEELMYERSEEHTSELQSRGHLVCRLLLEKKKKRAADDTLM